MIGFFLIFYLIVYSTIYTYLSSIEQNCCIDLYDLSELL